jgi:extradiol dioxygenase family protein
MRFVRGSQMSAFRIAVPVSDVKRSRDFYGLMLSMQAAKPVPSRPYFDCDDFILAVGSTAGGRRQVQR